MSSDAKYTGIKLRQPLYKVKQGANAKNERSTFCRGSEPTDITLSNVNTQKNTIENINQIMKND